MTSQFESYQNESDTTQTQAKAAVCNALQHRIAPDYSHYLDRGRLERSRQAFILFKALTAQIRKLTRI